MIVPCRRDCYDSNARRFYKRGQEYDIERTDPLAKNFEFPPEEPKQEVKGSEPFDDDFLK